MYENISREEMLTRFKKVFAENSKITKTFYNKNHSKLGLCSINLIRYGYGGLNNFLKEAGVKFYSRYPEISRKQAIRRLQKAIKNNPKMTKSYLCRNYKKLGICTPERIKKGFRSVDNFGKAAGINFYNNYIKPSKKELFENIKKVFNENNNITTKGFLYKNYKSLGIWSKNDIEMEFGNVDNFLEEAGVELKRSIGKTSSHCFHTIGNNETFILDFIEKKKGIKILRQYRVRGWFADGYDIINKVIYEVDEPYHLNNYFQDKMREQEIKKVLGCTFVRINERKFMRNIKKGLVVV